MLSAPKYHLRTFFLIYLLIFSIFTVFPDTLLAQTPGKTKASEVLGAASMGVARMIEVAGKDIKDGSVVSSTDKGAILSNTPYDPQVVGVVSRDAAIILSNTTNSKAVPVIPNGTVYLLVSIKEGKIKKGDLLTTSTIPGVAVKASKTGYVLGTALEGTTSTDASKPDKIAIDLNLNYFNAKPTFAGSLTDIIKIAILSTKESPTAVFKYGVAAAVVLGSLILGFVSFGRTAAKGVEALGRNPSASKMIQLGIIFNVSIVIVIALAGLAIAFLILRL